MRRRYHEYPMTRAWLQLLIAVTFFIPTPSMAQPLSGRGLVLENQPVRFDSTYVPSFTAEQMRHTAQSTRSGLAMWAQTTEGHQWITKLRSGEYEVVVKEGRDKASLGTADEPGIATLVATADPTKVKRFHVTLNPDVADAYTVEGAAFAEIPDATVAMAAAWGGEMLHVSFYAAGIRLPHHDRADFQRRWRVIAAELGVPTMKHGSDTNEER